MVHVVRVETFDRENAQRGEPYFEIEPESDNPDNILAALRVGFPNTRLHERDGCIVLSRGERTSEQEIEQPWRTLTVQAVYEVATKQPLLVMMIDHDPRQIGVYQARTSREITRQQQLALRHRLGVFTHEVVTRPFAGEWLYRFFVTVGNALPEPHEIAQTLDAQLAPDETIRTD